MSNSKDEPVTLKYSEQNGPGTFTYEWGMRFIELVNEKTNGTVKIEMYPNNTLSAGSIEAVQTGITDFVQMPPSSAADLDPRLGAFDAPYIYEDIEHVKKVFDPRNSQAMDMVNEKLKESNVFFVGSVHGGARHLTCNSPIYSLSDLKGKKIRVVPSDLYIKLWESFGAAATPMAGSEIGTSLLTNVIEGQEQPMSGLMSLKIWELQDYLITTGHMPANSGCWKNRKKWDALSENQQSAILEAMYEATVEWDDKLHAEEADDLKFLEDNGMTIITEADGLKIDEFKTAANSIYENYKDLWSDMPDVIRGMK